MKLHVIVLRVAALLLSLMAASARSDADCGGLTADYSVKAAATDWTVSTADCSAGQTALTPPAQPMVVTRQKLIATGGAPYRSPSHRHPAGGDPVLGDGEFYEQRVDATLAGLGPHYEFKRTYRSRVNSKGTLGYGWDHNYNQRILGVLSLSPEEHIGPYCDNTIDYQDGELNLIHFSLYAFGTNTFYYRAPGVSLVLNSVTDGNGYLTWRMVDGDGTIYLFNTTGFLSEIDDPAGNKLTFTWEYPPPFVQFPDDKLHGRVARLTGVTDAARTVHYIYNADNTLACVSLGTSCGTSALRDPGVLAYFSYSTHSELAAVYHGSGNSPAVEHYNYRSATVPTLWPTPYLPVDCVPNATLPGLCHSLCDAPAGSNPMSCRNLNYAAPIVSYCEGWTCQGSSPATSTCRQVPQQSQPDQLCMGLYNMAPDCVSGCIARYQCANNVDLRASYAFGGFEDLVHNLTDVSDESNRLIVHNDYGEDPWNISFDRVIAQHLGPTGDEPNTITFAYHDLQLEGTPPAIRTDPGSVPDPTNVVPQSVYNENDMCPVDGTCRTGPDGSCSIFGYGAPRAVGPTLKNPLPVNAVVITDIHGVTRTQYFDDQYNLIREVNDTNHEVTSYNYDLNAFLRAVAEPSGVRTCFERDAVGHIRQQSTLPAPGYSGAQTANVSAYLYDGANQLTDRWIDVLGTNTKTHYGRDPQERVTSIAQDVQSGQPPETTTFSYDEDPPPAGIRETPATIVHFDRTVDTFRGMDPSLGGPQSITLDVNGALPEHRYAHYDDHGRVIEEGELNRFAQRYGYDTSNKLTAMAHQLDASSPWVTTTVTSHESDGTSLDTITEPQREVMLTYLGHYPNVAWRIPSASTSGEQTQISCLHFDADGRFEGKVYPVGNELEYVYDAAGRVVTKRLGFPSGTPPSSAWRKSCNGRPVPAGDTGKQNIATWSYQSGGFLAGFSERDLGRKVITDGFGRVLQTDTLYPSSVDVASIQTGYDSQGRIAWIAEIAASLSMPHNTYQKPTMQTPGLLSMVEYEHDLIGRTTAERHWVIETGEVFSQTWTFDDAHRTTTAIDRGAATTTVVDGRGRLISRTFPDGSLLQAAHYLGYDIVSRQTNQTSSLTRTVEYDTRGNTTGVLDENGMVLYTATYDDHSNRITERGAGEGLTTHTFDLFDRLYREHTDNSNGPVTDRYFAWDANDRLASANGFALTYTGFNAPLTATDPLGRVDRISYVNGFVSPAGRVDGTGRHSCFRYDYDMRAAYSYDVDCPSASDIRGVATPLVERRALSYTSKGELATIRTTVDAVHSAPETVAYSYDSLGRETNEVVTSSTAVESYSVHHDFHDLGRTMTTVLSGTMLSSGLVTAVLSPSITKIGGGDGCPPGFWCPPPHTTPFMATTQQSYDAEGRLFGVDYNGSRIATWDHGIGAGGPLSLTYANGSTTSYSYDNRLRQKRMDVTFRATGSTQSVPIASLADVYGSDSEPRMRQRTFGNGPTITDVYQIDGDGRVTAENLRVVGLRLLSGEIDDAAVAPYLTGGDWRYYDVDIAGNWRSVASYSHGALSDQIDALGRLTAVGTKTMTIDGQDNLRGLVGDTLAFSFDPWSGLMSTASNGAVTYHYYYDALNRRTKEVGSDGTTTMLFWDRDQIIAHGDPGDVTFDVPGFDIDAHIASFDVTSGVGQYYHQSVDQSVLAVSNNSGFVEGYSYSAYGERTIWDGNGNVRATAVANSRFGFQGQLYDPATATYAMRSRQYVPTWGRFASPDPLSFVAAPSLYSFTGSRPLSMRDPLGLSTDLYGDHGNHPCSGPFCGTPPPTQEPTTGPSPPPLPQPPSPPSGPSPGPGAAPQPPPTPPPSDGGGLDPSNGSVGGGPSRDPSAGGPGGGGGGRGGGISRLPPDRVFAGPVTAPRLFPQMAQAMAIADEVALWCTETDCIAKMQELLEILPGFTHVASQLGDGSTVLGPGAPPSAVMAEKAPGRPTANDGYTAPKKYNGQKVRNPNGGGYGWLDDKGRVWVPTGDGPGTTAHGGPHWDVQSPGGGYVNIFPGGRQR